MRLYVGNLPWETKDADLVALFDKFGSLKETKIITDRETGRSKGFGFVEFHARADGQTAMDTLNNSDYGGRQIVVSQAREKSGGTRRDNYRE